MLVIIKFCIWLKHFQLFTASLSVFPVLNAATLEALILIVLPVCGFLPVRAAREQS
jgi:hypothetical protein